MKNNILIKGIECYAYHGCMDEEALIGQLYSVDIMVDVDFEKSMQTDNLDDTIDYAMVNKIVLEQMAIRSKLIEHVAGRILKALESAFPNVINIKVSVTKFNPPVNGNIKQVTATTSKNKRNVNSKDQNIY